MRAELVEKFGVAKDLFHIQLAVEGLKAEPKPGQFFMIYPPRSDLILGRPISIFGYEPGKGRSIVEFLIKSVGRGTASILNIPKSGELRVLGPFGNWFDDNDLGSERIWLVAGGYGVAPLRFFMKSLVSKGWDVNLIHGYKSGQEVVNCKILGLPEDKVFCACEDGSAEFCGTAYDLWEWKVEEVGKGVTVACGPAGLLKSLWKGCARRNLRLIVSLEARMGCGFGVCFSCSVPKLGGGYLRACYDGPIFEASDVDWDRFEGA